MTFWKDSISLELIQINHSPHEDFMPEKDGDNMISYKRNIGEQVDREWLKCFVNWCQPLRNPKKFFIIFSHCLDLSNIILLKMASIPNIIHLFHKIL